ncbi:Prolipoprotein diacylglyceryl transferase [hydrothermal vent metagenome]|uniref:Prolipoprotein diacylglyceryl transferase n=1 Tax=hydrothermal vent metagenome TaxID=652676 RepID=A0A3B0TDS8_9ZZZZ
MLSVLTFPAIDPVAIAIGPVAIRWYSLAYIGGIFIGWMYLKRLVARASLWSGAAPLSKDDAEDVLIWAAIGIIFGGRIGYVLFYDPARILSDPLSAFKVWEGGMSFHGGFLGVIIALLIFARRRGISPLCLGDLAATAAPIGLFFGRLANFINGELYGRVTDVPWAMVFPGAGPLPRHPSQLYEAALEGLVLFIALRIATHVFGALGRPGMVTGLFFVGYGLFRFFVEFFRMPDLHIGFLAGGLTMGMILSLPMIPIGLGFIAYARRKAQT